MKTSSKLVVTTLTLFGLGACGSAADEIKVTAQKPDVTAPVATVKPGADVALNSILPKAMVVGEFQTVRLEFTEGYTAGSMSVQIEPSAGLRLFGGSSAKTFDMSQTGAHNWDVDVAADVDGVYFLKVFAMVDNMPRSFSVCLDIGTVTQKMFDDAMPADGEITDGGKIRVLDATETIK